MNSWIWSLLIIMQCAPLYTKVLIFTYSYNRPDFIEIQYRTFQNFLEDDYKFVVFNDASNVELETKINLTCKNLNIECIRIPPNNSHIPISRTTSRRIFQSSYGAKC